MRKRLLSGMRPTGKLHIGHLFGALENWVKLQERYDCFFMVADYHALTTPVDVSKIQKDIREMVLDFLAAGIDPQKSTLFIQSRVPEHTELALLLGMFTPLGWLLRCPTYKEQIREYPDFQNFGLLGYPILQAADILIYKAEAVPVGEDQVAHLEIAREIARSFNHKFACPPKSQHEPCMNPPATLSRSDCGHGNTEKASAKIGRGKIFPEPEAILSKTPKIMGLDRPSEKMSKSFGDENCLYLADSPEVLREKIKKAVTDMGPGKSIKYQVSSIKKSPGVANLFQLIKLCSPPKTLEYFQNRYQGGNLKYEDLKETLAKDVAQYLRPLREKRGKLKKRPEDIEEILEKGSQKARQEAQKTIKEVKEKMGL